MNETEFLNLVAPEPSVLATADVAQLLCFTDEGDVRCTDKKGTLLPLVYFSVVDATNKVRKIRRTIKKEGFSLFDYLCDVCPGFKRLDGGWISYILLARVVFQGEDEKFTEEEVYCTWLSDAYQQLVAMFPNRRIVEIWIPYGSDGTYAMWKSFK